MVALLHDHVDRNQFHRPQLYDSDLQHTFPFVLHQLLVEFHICMIISVIERIYLSSILNVVILFLHRCFIFVIYCRNDFFEFLFSLNFVNDFIRNVSSFQVHFHLLAKHCLIQWTRKTFFTHSGTKLSLFAQRVV